MDIKDCIASYFQLLDQRLQSMYLGKFSTNHYEEPEIWDGIGMHTFY